MSVTDHANYETCSRFLSAACFVILLGTFSGLSAQCPMGNRSAWRQGSTVTFHIDPNMSPAEQEGIRNAITKWNAANQTNGSGVTFQEVTNPGQTPTALNFENGVNPVTNSDGTTSYASGQTSPHTGSDGTLNSATVTIDPNTRAGVDTTPGTPGLDTIFEKIALHELGHTMGLGEVAQSEQVAGRTVMNNGWGVNDRFNNISRDLQNNPCDQNAIHAEPGYAPPPPLSGGGPCDPSDPTCGRKAGCYYDPIAAQSCPGYYDPTWCLCDPDSPIIIDVMGDGFDLTNAAGGASTLISIVMVVGRDFHGPLLHQTTPGLCSIATAMA